MKKLYTLFLGAAVALSASASAQVNTIVVHAMVAAIGDFTYSHAAAQINHWKKLF